MNNLNKSLFYVIDLLCVPFIVFSALLLKIYRRIGSMRLRFSTRALKLIGIFPIRDHYYEPLFNDKHLTNCLSEQRVLPGVILKESEQIELLKELTYQDEFSEFVESESSKNGEQFYKLSNSMFGPADSEFLFNFIRHTKPKRVIEVGCGTSTKIIHRACELNQQETGETTSHICIEPYEQSWLEQFPKIELIREKIENVNVELFKNLNANDFLFIDSSHMIRPQGDILYEYLTIIPSLNKGVYIHVHDIFTPYDYPDRWVKESIIFWNEQYLLEALLTDSSSLKVIAALNALSKKYIDDFTRICPHFDGAREPGSFYMQKVDIAEGISSKSST